MENVLNRSKFIEFIIILAKMAFCVQEKGDLNQWNNVNIVQATQMFLRSTLKNFMNDNCIEW